MPSGELLINNKKKLPVLTLHLSFFDRYVWNSVQKSQNILAKFKNGPNPSWHNYGQKQVAILIWTFLSIVTIVNMVQIG